MSTDPPALGRAFAPGLLVLLVALALLRFLAGLDTTAYLGFDTYPLFAAAQDGPVAAFTDELMGGRYPDGRFWRPVTSLAFWIDGALGGQSVAFTRALDGLFLALAAFAVARIAAQLTDRGGASEGGARLAALVAGIAVVGHGAALDVVPFPARRADLIATCGIGWAVHAALRGAPAWRVGLATLVAILAKESGVLAVPLVALVGGQRAATRRVAAGARAALVPAAAVLLAVIGRFAVLGELGGHAESGLPGLDALKSAFGIALGAQSGAVVPPLPTLLLAGATALVLLRRQPLRGLLPLAWFGGALLIASASGRPHSWYAITFVPPLALVAGVVAGNTYPRRGLALGVAAVSALALLPLRGENERIDDLERAMEAAAEQETRFEALARSKNRLETLEPFVFGVQRGKGSEVLYVHAPYSLAAFAEVALPERDVRVRGPLFEPRLVPEDPDVIVRCGPPRTLAAR